MKTFIQAGVAALLTVLAACAPPAPPQAQTQPSAAAPQQTDLPAGVYTLDKAHSSLVFRVSHLGFSNYVGRFTDFDARLELDPANPAAASLNVTIDPRSLDADNAPAGFLGELTGAQWLAVGQYPEMSYRSTNIELTGPNTARITGDFTMHGATRPVVLEATFNGGYTGHPLDPHARIGFSAQGVLKRSEFGVANGIPAPGTTMGVGDEVTIQIETEFSGPAWTPPAAPAP